MSIYFSDFTSFSKHIYNNNKIQPDTPQAFLIVHATQPREKKINFLFDGTLALC